MSLQQQQQFQQLQQQLLPQLQQQVKQEDGGAWDDGVAAFIKSLLHMLQDPENVEVIYWYVLFVVVVGGVVVCFSRCYFCPAPVYIGS